MAVAGDEVHLRGPWGARRSRADFRHDDGLRVQSVTLSDPAMAVHGKQSGDIAVRENNDFDTACINTIRTLSMDAVQAANSGHPGTPMALAPVAYCLWQNFLRIDPQDPIWPNRDRFVLSAGHASMLLYSLLHLTGVKAVSKDYETLGEPSVPLDAIKRFRQLDSRCPSHPEYRWTSGVEHVATPVAYWSRQRQPPKRSSIS
jgi:hypothetical protein